MQQEIYMYLIIFIYGIIIGSFLNVLIYRLPKKEDIVIKSSSCTKCGHKLQWYDLVPLFSYICLRGRCRYCKEKISAQYPIIEGLNGIIYIIIFLKFDFSVTTSLMCLFSSILIAISVIDYRTFEIPDILNIVLVAIAIISLFFTQDILERILGFVLVSGFMYLLLILFRALRNVDCFGGGDIKLMAAAGLFLGGRRIVLAFFIGCILGSVIHLMRMRFKHVGNVLAFGPYLCTGIFISMLFGWDMLNFYMGLLNFSL